MVLDAGHVPANVGQLMPLAQKWGVQDDAKRAELLEDASDEELVEISESVGSALDDLEAWLAGQEASAPQPTDEYVAFSCLIMAMYKADLILARRSGTRPH